MKGPVCIIAYIFAFVFTTNAQLIWQISGNSTKAKSYLFATDQITDISFLDTIPNLFKIYGKCANVISEMQYSDSELQTALTHNAIIADSITLKDIYSPNEYKEISDAIELYLQLPLDKIERLKPVYINEMLRQALLEKWAGYDATRSTEYFFQSLAVQTDKPLIGLDNTGEIIYMLFEREPIDWQKTELLRTIRNPEKEIQQAKAISKFYKDGKLNEIAYQVAMPDNRTSISYSDYKTYCARNKEWVKKLAPYLHEGGQFIVLNCIYLGGDEGLIAQLRKVGYKVKPYNRPIMK